jgi:probable HAF family extracellular repeat protein
MSSQILITMDDLETTVRLNAAFETAGIHGGFVSALNYAAQVDGARWGVNGYHEAFLWKSRGMKGLGTLGGGRVRRPTSTHRPGGGQQHQA